MAWDVFTYFQVDGKIITYIFSVICSRTKIFSGPKSFHLRHKRHPHSIGWTYTTDIYTSELHWEAIKCRSDKLGQVAIYVWRHCLQTRGIMQIDNYTPPSIQRAVCPILLIHILIHDIVASIVWKCMLKQFTNSPRKNNYTGYQLYVSQHIIFSVSVTVLWIRDTGMLIIDYVLKRKPHFYCSFQVRCKQRKSWRYTS